MWKQQLGVFDHNNWNHPGPAYFYLVSLVYRVLGSSARSLFVGATLLNGLSAVACVAVVRRRTTAARALWAAVWVVVLVAVLAAAGPSATTYSESVLGALVSPWNPTVVLFPLLLLVLLCAGAVDRSAASLVGALLVGTFVVQTDISTAPLAVALVGPAAVAWAVTAVRDRPGPGGGPDGAVAHPAGGGRTGAGRPGLGPPGGPAVHRPSGEPDAASPGSSAPPTPASPCPARCGRWRRPWAWSPSARRR